MWAWVFTRVHGVLRLPALPCPVPTPVGDRDAVRAALPVVLGVPLSAFAAGSAQPSPRSLSPLCSLCFHPGYGETGWGVAMLRPPHPPTRCCVGASTQLPGKLVLAVLGPGNVPGTGRGAPGSCAPSQVSRGGSHPATPRLRMEMEGVPLLSWSRQGVGVPYPDIRQGIQPFPRAGSVPGTPDLLKVLPAPGSWGCGCFSVPLVAPWLSHRCWCGGCCAGSTPPHTHPGKPSPGFRAVPPPKLPEATWLLQPQWWLFPHFNEEYISSLLIISHQTAPEAVGVHMPVEKALCSF